MDKTSQHTIVLIGGGLGGLTTGAFLAKEGYAVTVLEKNPTIGGGLQCFHRRGVLFETGMHVLGGFLPGQTLHKICAYLGILDELRLRHTDADCIDSVTFGTGETYRLPRGREAFERYLATRFPAEAEGLHRYLDTLWGLSEEVDLFYLRPSGDSLAMAHSDEFLMPADELIARYVTDPALAELLAYMNPMYGGVAGHTPAFIHALINVLYIDGSSLFVDGSQQMADALARVIVEGGGRVEAGDPVTAIEVEDRAVRQVVTRSGRRYEGEYYISDIHPCALLELLPEKAFPYVKELQERAKSKTVLSSASELTMEVVEREKKLELWLEGCRWPDMVRWGHTDGVVNAGTAVPVLYDKLIREPIREDIIDPETGEVATKADENIRWQYGTQENSRYYLADTHVAKDFGAVVGFKAGKHERFPFPYQATSINPNITQNPGWTN